jgi:peptide/nickel transport system substrate-binding protein
MGHDERMNYWTRRRASRRGVLRGVALGAAGLGLAGCAGGTTAPAATSAPAAPPPAAASTAATAPTAAPTTAPAKRGGMIKTIATASEGHLDPHMTGGFSVGSYGPGMCYSQLLSFKYGKDIKPTTYIINPDLAESWTQADDTTYVFKIRPGVKWHNIPPVNGRELKADDIAYTYQHIRDIKSPYASFLAGITKFDAVDATTLRISLDKPNADLLDNLAAYYLVIVAKERVDQGGDLKSMPLIGTGPFILDTFEVGQRIVTKRNPDFFQKGLPYIDGVESFRTADASTPPNAFRSGDLNVVGSGMTIQGAEDLVKQVPKASLIYAPLDRNPVQFVVNASQDLFKDIRVRQAIHKAIDRKAMIDTIFLGRSEISTGFSLPDASWKLPADELNRLFARDLAGAKQLLKDAGKENSLSFKILAPTYQQGQFVTVCELIQANLKEAGITTTLETLDTATHAARQASGNYDAFLAVSSGGSPNGWLYSRYYTGGSLNYSKFSNPELDKLIDQQAVMVKDVEGRKKALMDVQRMTVTDAVYMTLNVYPQPTLSAPEVKDFYPPLPGTVYNKVWDAVWIDK